MRGVVQNIGIDLFIDDLSNVDSKGLNYQNCEVLFHVNKQSPDIAGGVHVVRDDLDAGVDNQSGMIEDGTPLTRLMATRCDLRCSRHHGKTQVIDVPVVTRRAPTTATQHRSTQQHNHHKQEQRTEQAMQEGERDHREEVRKVRKKEKGMRGKKEKGREAEEERDKEIKKDVTCWTVVTRSKREKKRTIQIFVKVNESRTFPQNVSTDDKVNDVIRQIQSEEDV